jgi:prevent-host-death family protein
MEVSVRELKDGLSRYLRAAQAGEEIVVTSHGKPVARLVAIPAQPRDTTAAVVEELNRLPWVRPGGDGAVVGSVAPMAPSTGGRPLSEVLLDDRE